MQPRQLLSVHYAESNWHGHLQTCQIFIPADFVVTTGLLNVIGSNTGTGHYNWFITRLVIVGLGWVWANSQPGGEWRTMLNEPLAKASLFFRSINEALCPRSLPHTHCFSSTRTNTSSPFTVPLLKLHEKAKTVIRVSQWQWILFRGAMWTTAI